MSTRWPQLVRTTVVGRDRFREAEGGFPLLIDLVVNEPSLGSHSVIELLGSFV